MSRKLLRAGRVLPALTLMSALSLAGCHELLRPHQGNDEPQGPIGKCEPMCRDTLDVASATALPRPIRVKVDGRDVLDECLTNQQLSGRRYADSGFSFEVNDGHIREGDRIRIQIESRADCATAPGVVLEQEIVVPTLDSLEVCGMVCRQGKITIGSGS